MSHFKERKEKNCLNCNAQVYGTYCHICGQENTEPKHSAWHLVTHFFQDITHFDGKFFSTLRMLLWRPGFLSREYMAGRRASYLNPIRMYIFTSAFFFLIFFSVTHIDTVPASQRSPQKAMAYLQKREKATLEAMQELKDSGLTDRKLDAFLADIRADMDTLRKDSTSMPRLRTLNTRGFSIGTGSYNSLKEYDSAQRVLPEKEKDGWLIELLMRKALAAKEKYRDNSLSFALLNKFLHSFPQILFVSLPLFALLLKLLYSRRRQFYYVDHGIFSIHLYIFSFITILFIMGINRLELWLHWRWLSVVSVLLSIGILFYLYKAMRNFYQQRRAKTIFKFILLCIAAALLFVVLFAVFFVFSFFQL